MFWANALAAFSIGLLGSGHCAAMCGSLIAGHSMVRVPLLARFPRTSIAPALSVALHAPGVSKVLLLNVGRIGSYMILAGVVAAAGGVLITPFAADLLRSIGAGLMVLIGLYIGGWSRWALAIEKYARRLFRGSHTADKSAHAHASLRRTLLSGLLWGAIPCGMVHSTVLWAGTSEHPLEAAVTMFAFGCGTLPAMLTAGLAGYQLQRRLGHIRPVAAATLIVFGVLMFPPVQRLVFPLGLAGHHDHAHMTQ
ncbi:MAG: sulfite exporter TauE/SafE family protein [Gammaproteobacteria bacterium]